MNSSRDAVAKFSLSKQQKAAGEASRHHKRLRQAAIETAVEFFESGRPASELVSYLRGQWQVVAREVGAERATLAEFQAVGVEAWERLRRQGDRSVTS